MDPTPLNAVRAAVANVAADTSGTAVAAPFADIAGAAADIAADAWAAALADSAADTAVVAADAAADTTVVAADTRAAALADAAADIAAAVDSAGDLCRRACRVRRHCGLHVPRSALLALKPAARAWLPSVPSELLLSSSTRTRPPTNSARLKSGSTQSLSSREHTRGETIQDSAANLLFRYLNIVILYVEG